MSEPQVQILTEEELDKAFREVHIQLTSGEAVESLLLISKSHRELFKANAELSFKNQKLKEKDAKVAEFMDWAKRIIDSGMGAGILRYNPVQFFIDYHTYLISIGGNENEKH